MLHKGYGGYDLVRSDFTSLNYAAPASEVDLVAGDGNLACQRIFTGQDTTDFMTSLCAACQSRSNGSQQVARN